METDRLLRTPMCPAQHHSITYYRHNQKKGNTASSPQFLFIYLLMVTRCSKILRCCHKRMTSNRIFNDLRKWSKISFEFFNSFVQFILEPLNIVSRSLHLFLSLFLLFFWEKYREVENPQQHERKCEGEEKKTNILLSVKCPPCPSTMGTFHRAG